MGFVLLFATSIPLARILGPAKLDYFNYIAWLTAMSTNLGNLGIPAMAGKFMAEYLGRGERGPVRAIFFSTLRLQTAMCAGVTALALGLVVFAGKPEFRAVSILQVLCILPGMMVALPSHANIANERMVDNFLGSMASAGLYLIGVLLSLFLGWGLIGVAASLLISRSAELLIRMVPCTRWILSLPAGQITVDLKSRMRTFGGQQLVMLALGLVIWDKSDVVLLEHLSRRPGEITFFTISYNLTERALLLPRVFAAAVSASLMAQYGRNAERMKAMTIESARYMLLLGAPLLGGMAMLSPVLMYLLYGKQYLSAIPVLALACLFAVPKTVIDPVDAVFRANNRQGPIVFVALTGAVLNIALDWFLIPGRGAVGAALGNGISQSFVVLAYWAVGVRLFGLQVTWSSLWKLLLATAAMAPPVLLCTRTCPAIPAMVLGVLSGAVVFLAMLRVLSFFTPEDLDRLERLRIILPRFLRPAFGLLLNALIPPHVPAVAAP